MPQAFWDRFEAAIRAGGTPAVVGIDPVLESLPDSLRAGAGSLEAAARAIESFSRECIDCVAPIVPAVKINSAFFEAYYEAGVAAFFRLIEHAHARGLLVISDVKRGDVGSTARLYARGHLADPELAGVSAARVPDAVTLAGYLGENAVRPFVEAGARHGRGVFVLVRPSDPGADEVHEFGGDERFYQHMARLVSRWGGERELIGASGYSCVGAVVAAKDAASTRVLRAALPHTPLLVPGFGAQGGTAVEVAACFAPGGRGAIVNASRSVIFAYQRAEIRERAGDDWQACVAEAAREFARQVAQAAQG